MPKIILYPSDTCTIFFDILAEKRKLDADSGPAASRSKQDLLSDLIVLGLPYSATEDDLKSYFEKYGELAHCEVSHGNFHRLRISFLKCYLVYF